MKRFVATAFFMAGTSLLPVLALHAQQPPPLPTTSQPAEKTAEKTATTASSDPIDRIKEEGLQRSQVMATMGYLTDVIGPRLTGSPNLKRANEWTRDKLAAWGLANAHLEAWGPFGRGWTLKRFSAQVVAPQCIPLIGYPKAWSPGVEGTLEAPVVYFDAKTEVDFNKYKGKLKGAIVLVSPMREVPARFAPLAVRKTDTELLELADSDEPAPRGGRRGGGGPNGGPRAAGGPAGPTAAGAPTVAGGPRAAGAPGQQPRMGGRFRSPEMIAQMELQRKKMLFLAGEEVAMFVEPSTQGDGGTFFVQSASIPGAAAFGGGGGGPGRAQGPRVYSKDAPKIIPQLVLSKEHYNRLVRMCEAGESVKIAVELKVEFHDQDLMAYNTVAEIPGTDLKNEVVMLGGHMDSWHSGTGATDNGAGVSVGMEAMRILKALDLKPRRTIRIALWTGEEQGLMGSRAFVREHFGRSPQMGFGGGGPAGNAPAAGQNGNGNGTTKDSTDSTTKANYDNFSVYFNLDNGTGKIRGVYMEGNEMARPIFRKWLTPFREMGATTLTARNTGGTDHMSFDGIGLPGFQFIQDEVEYDTRTHHSNQDVFDRIQADDMKQASVIMAAFIYDAAMTDQKFPRKAPASSESRGAAPRTAAAP